MELSTGNRFSKTVWNYLLIFIITGWQVLHNDIVYCWFADFRARAGVFWARIFRRKSIVVIGGYEVKDIVYDEGRKAGHFQYILSQANLLLTVSDHYQKCLQESFPEYAGKLKMVYNGIEITDQNKAVIKKEKLVITVCSGKTVSRFEGKGIDIFLAAAERLPDFQFAIIGAEGELKKAILAKQTSNNIQIVPPVQQAELSQWYRKAKVYCQFSRHESFGLALVEAMSWQCVPVVNNIASLQERTGGSGFVVEDGNLQQAGKFIEHAMNESEETGRKIAERAISLYDIRNREIAVLTILRDAWNNE